MGSVNLPTVQEMTDIRTAIILLVIAMITGGTSIVGVLVAQYKWFLPKRFKQQTKERELQLKELEDRINTQRESGKVDIERDRILPQLVTTMQASITSQSQFFQSVGTYLQNQIEQDNRRQAELHAHSIAVSGNNDALNDLTGEFRVLQKTVEHLVTNVQDNTEVTKDTRVESKLATEQTRLTLELMTKFGRNLELVAKTAHDSKPIPLLMDADSNGVPPGQLQATG